MALIVALAGIFLWGDGVRAEARAEKSVSTSLEVPANTWKGIRLTRVAAGTDLEIRIETNGTVTLALLDDQAFSRLPGPVQPLVSGRTADTLALRAHIPESGEWYVVLDNRDGSLARKVQVSVQARAPMTSEPGTRPEQEGEMPSSDGTDLRSALDLVERALRGAFVVDSFEIQIVGCGGANAHAAPGRILVCRELVERIGSDLGADSRAASDVLLFVLMHEAAHVLLKSWDLPLTGNEEVADEMATVLLVMFGERHRLATVAAYFASLPEASPLPPTVRGHDVRHPVLAQRGRNLRRWMDDSELPRRWQTWLVPRMRTDLLERLAAAPRPWTAPPLVEAELAGRRRSVPAD